MANDKNEIRQAVKARLREYSKEQRAEMSTAISRMLMSRKEINEADTVIAYWPLPDEVDIRQAIRHWHSMGKTVLLPRVVNDKDMVLGPYGGDEALTAGAFDILEPTDRQDVTPPCHCPIIVPARAYDTHGNRIGRGKGYYDRFLHTYPTLLRIGVSYPCQIFDSLPQAPHDIPIPIVIHPKTSN